MTSLVEDGIDTQSRRIEQDILFAHDHAAQRFRRWHEGRVPQLNEREKQAARHLFEYDEARELYASRTRLQLQAASHGERATQARANAKQQRELRKARKILRHLHISVDAMLATPLD